jgi:hypothetical protein
MDKGRYEETENNKIVFRIDNYGDNRDDEKPTYSVVFNRTSKEYANVHIVNEQNDSILASEIEVKIKDLQKKVKKKSGMINETIEGLIDANEILTTVDAIKLNFNEALALIVGKWYDTDYFSDDEATPATLATIDVTDNMMQEAERILSCANPIWEVKKHLDNTIAGEDDNKLFVFTLALSGKMMDVKKKTIICALQEAGAGKTWVLQNIASFYKTKVDSHLTDRALNYMGAQLDEYEILFIKELGNLDKENNTSGNASIKMMSVDDGGLSTTYTLKNKDGEFETKTVTTNPITIMTSSTRKSIDNQFVRRYWVFSPDASVAQTRRIRQFKVNHNRQEEQKEMGIIKHTDFEYSQGVLQHLVSLIPSDINVLIPFWQTIYNIMDENNLRMRGDFDKVKLLIYLFGVLNYRNLPTVTKEVEGEDKLYHVMTPQMTIDILRIARQSLVFMAKGTEGRDYALLQALKDMNVIAVSETNSGTEIDREAIYNLASKLGWGLNRIKSTMNKFVDLSFVHEKDKPKVYMLTKSVEHIEGRLSGYPELSSEAELVKLYNRMVEESNMVLEKYHEVDFRFGDAKYVHNIHE